VGGTAVGNGVAVGGTAVAVGSGVAVEDGVGVGTAVAVCVGCVRVGVGVGDGRFVEDGCGIGVWVGVDVAGTLVASSTVGICGMPASSSGACGLAGFCVGVMRRDAESAVASNNMAGSIGAKTNSSRGSAP